MGGAPVVWRWRKDLSAAGQPLRMNKKEYAHGLGVHSYSKITFALDGAYAKLLGEVGLDAAAGPQTTCDWKVQADGKELAAGSAKAGETPQKISVSVTGAKSLDLICDYGPDEDDAGDHLDWAEARLVKP